MGVFWACLIATSNLQMAVPFLIVLAKESLQLPSLLPSSHSSLLQAVSSNVGNSNPKLTNVRSSDESHHLVTPTIFTSQILHLPTQLVSTRLFYLATTYLLAKRIVGPSGCGKSTIGALLLGQYTLSPSEVNGNLLQTKRAQ